MTSSERDLAWAMPDSCALPTHKRPLRVAEFDRFFRRAVRAVERQSPTQLRLDLARSPGFAAEAASLAARETACCSFFTFTLTATGDSLQLDVFTPSRYVEVLDALAVRANSAAGAPS